MRESSIVRVGHLPGIAGSESVHGAQKDASQLGEGGTVKTIAWNVLWARRLVSLQRSV